LPPSFLASWRALRRQKALEGRFVRKPSPQAPETWLVSMSGCPISKEKRQQPPMRGRAGRLVMVAPVVESALGTPMCRAIARSDNCNWRRKALLRLNRAGGLPRLMPASRARRRPTRWRDRMACSADCACGYDLHAERQCFRSRDIEAARRRRLRNRLEQGLQTRSDRDLATVRDRV